MKMDVQLLANGFQVRNLRTKSDLAELSAASAASRVSRKSAARAAAHNPTSVAPGGLDKLAQIIFVVALSSLRPSKVFSLSCFWTLIKGKCRACDVSMCCFVFGCCAHQDQVYWLSRSKAFNMLSFSKLRQAHFRFPSSA